VKFSANVNDSFIISDLLRLFACIAAAVSRATGTNFLNLLAKKQVPFKS